MEKQKITLKLSQIAELTGGVLYGEDVSVSGISVPEDQKAGTVTMINVQGNAHLIEGSAEALIIADNVKVETNKPIVRVKDTRPVLVKLMYAFHPAVPVTHNISKLSAVAESATIGNPVNIGNFVTIGEDVSIGDNSQIYHGCSIGDDVKIGKNCIIYPNVTIYENCTIGDNVIIHSGAVIGADGFGFIPGANPTKIPQKGTVIIEDYVELGANSCVDRATIGATVVGFGSKIDNLVMIGHNTRLGKACLVASQVGFSGSIEVGDYVVAGGQAGFSDHIKIASGSVFGGQAGIPNDIKEKGNYLGSPCMPLIKYAKSFSVFQELPELKRRVINLEKQSN